MFVREIVGGTLMTNVMTSAHADAHCVGLNEQFCQTAQTEGRLYISLRIYIRALPLLLNWCQAENH